MMTQEEHQDQLNEELIRATLNQENERVKQALKEGASINNAILNADSIVSYFILYEDLEMIKYIFESNDFSEKLNQENKDKALIEGAYSGNMQIIKYLVEHGANPKIRIEGYSPILKASYVNCMEGILYLIEHGADVTENGNEILKGSIEMENIPMVEFLIGIGCDINIVLNHNTPSMKQWAEKYILKQTLENELNKNIKEKKKVKV